MSFSHSSRFRTTSFLRSARFIVCTWRSLSRRTLSETPFFLSVSLSVSRRSAAYSGPKWRRPEAYRHGRGTSAFHGPRSARLCGAKTAEQTDDGYSWAPSCYCEGLNVPGSLPRPADDARHHARGGVVFDA